MPLSQPWKIRTRPVLASVRSLTRKRCQDSSLGRNVSDHLSAADAVGPPCRPAALTVRNVAMAWTGGWQMPLVRGAEGASGLTSAEAHRSGPGKYPLALG